MMDESSNVARADASRRLGLLIDTENGPAGCADELMRDLGQLGQVVEAQAFGDFRLTETESWSKACKKHGIEEMQFDRHPAGKNTADVALVVTAMDFLHQGKVDALVLVSSDTDYIALINRYTAEGLPVYLYGRRQTPDRLKDAVTRFVHVENLRRGHPAYTPGSKAKALRQPKDLLPLLGDLAAKLRDVDGWVSIEALLNELLELDRHFDCRDYGFRHLVDLCARHPHCVVQRRTDLPPRIRISKKGISDLRKAAKRRDHGPIPGGA